MSESNPTFFARFGLALRLLFDGAFAAECLSPRGRAPQALPQAAVAEPLPAVAEKPVHVERDLGSAMQLLEVLQREGRLIDFLRQDIIGFSDSDVGAAARIVHQGCRRAVDQIADIEPIRTEPEGGSVTLEVGFNNKAHRLVGNVQGHPPYRGTLKHRGWRITRLTLEEPLAGADLNILAAAEVEL